jgi:hypothetical protein
MELFHSLLDYWQMGDIARELRDSLAFRLVAPQAALPSYAKRAFKDARMQLGDAREGFVISLRAADVANTTELRKLVNAVLLDWGHAEALFGFDVMPDDKIEMPRMQLIAFAHSYATFGLMPTLPPDEVTFPQQRRTYADIHAPRTPGEVLERIEELERVVTEAELEPLDHIDHNRLRRTYGFFETSAWLVAHHAAQFASKRH